MRIDMTSRRQSGHLKMKLLASTMLISLSLPGTASALDGGESFIESRQALERQIASSKGDEHVNARLLLMKLYMERGFYREAYALAASTADTAHAMSHAEDRERAKIAFILARLPDSEDRLDARNFTLADPGKENLWQLVYTAQSGKAIPGGIKP